MFVLVPLVVSLIVSCGGDDGNYSLYQDCTGKGSQTTNTIGWGPGM